VLIGTAVNLPSAYSASAAKFKLLFQYIVIKASKLKTDIRFAASFSPNNCADPLNAFKCVNGYFFNETSLTQQ
jgi:hypothetical protein